MNIEQEFVITSTGKKGQGIACLQGADQRIFPVNVPYAIPGDRVQVALKKRRKGVYDSRLLQVLTPSPFRDQPRCAHFGTCGGCRWQQIQYAQQLQIKTSIVQDQFQSLLSGEVVWHPIIGCDPPWGYRNKMEYTFGIDTERQQALGLMHSLARHKVVNLQECHLTREWFIDALQAAKAWWLRSGLNAYHPSLDKGSLRTLTVREGLRTGDRMVILTVSGNPDYALDEGHLETFVSAMREAAETSTNRLSVFLITHRIAKGQPSIFEETLLHGPRFLRETLNGAHQPFTFHIGPTAFFQPNPVQAERLYALAIQMAQLTGNEIVYDLYCGTGALGMFAAHAAKEVIGVELNPVSVESAQHNIALNQIHNMRIYAGDVGQLLQTASLPSPDVILVDPPRSGLDETALKHLLRLMPQKIVYVSCNPTTQAANIKYLVEGGFRLKALQPVDQFSQTVHIENIAFMEMREFS
jgi:23S rRNA (uracil1939-C5)-methyltransferase